MRKLGLLAILSGLLLLPSIEAKASTFSFLGGDIGVLPNNWNPSNAPSGLDAITIFDEGKEGIWLNDDADLVYTYIGKEAGATNASSTSIVNQFFITDGSTFANEMFSTSGTSGFLDFSFERTGGGANSGIFTNGLGNTGNNGFLSLAVAMIDKSSLYLMFGDGAGDKDWDDMVVKVEAFAVSAVPVPSAFWLFGTALIGFVGFSRRTRVS